MEFEPWTSVSFVKCSTELPRPISTIHSYIDCGPVQYIPALLYIYLYREAASSHWLRQYIPVLVTSWASSHQLWHRAFSFSPWSILLYHFSVRWAFIQSSFTIHIAFVQRSQSIHRSFIIHKAFTVHNHIIIRNFNEKGLIVFIVRKWKRNVYVKVEGK
jgi:hypothetical protein